MKYLLSVLIGLICITNTNAQKWLGRHASEITGYETSESELYGDTYLISPDSMYFKARETLILNEDSLCVGGITSFTYEEGIVHILIESALRFNLGFPDSIHINAISIGETDEWAEEAGHLVERGEWFYDYIWIKRWEGLDILLRATLQLNPDGAPLTLMRYSLVEKRKHKR